jgi:hypothetical protein
VRTLSPDDLQPYLEGDETVQAVARATDAALALTHRPATLAVVPESPQDVPQVHAIPPEEYASAARFLVVIGERFAAA